MVCSGPEMSFVFPYGPSSTESRDTQDVTHLHFFLGLHFKISSSWECYSSSISDKHYICISEIKRVGLTPLRWGRGWGCSVCYNIIVFSKYTTTSTRICSKGTPFTHAHVLIMSTTWTAASERIECVTPLPSPPKTTTTLDMSDVILIKKALLLHMCVRHRLWMHLFSLSTHESQLISSSSSHSATILHSPPTHWWRWA